MIEKESVIPIESGFYEVGKINTNQKIWGRNGLTLLKSKTYGMRAGFLIETKHFSIVVSDTQEFITPTGTKKAGFLEKGDIVLTKEGDEVISKEVDLISEDLVEMFNPVTDDGTYVANGFYLICQ